MSTPTQQLLHCPFCGHDSPEVCDGYVVCPNCGASTHEFDTPDEATAAWNSRASLPAPQERSLATDSAVEACMRIARDLRNHDVVRMAAAKCADAVRMALTGSDLDSRTPTVAPGGQPLLQADSQEGFGDSVLPPVEPSGATLSPCAASQWISVDTRLPSEDGTYLVWLSDVQDAGWATDRAWTASWWPKQGGWEDCDPMEDGCEVTHWMPLPEPPQVDRGESSSERGES